MELDITFSLKKGYEVLEKCKEMKFYIILIFLNSVIFQAFAYFFIPPMNSMMTLGEDSKIVLHPDLIKFLIIYFSILIISAIISTFFLSAAIKSTYDHLKGSSSMKKSLKRALETLISILGASVLFTLAVIAPIFMGLLVIFVPICCMLILIMPLISIYFAIRLIFFEYPIVLFKRKAVEGLEESWEITDGRVLEVGVFLLILFLITVPFMLFTSTLSNNLIGSVALSFISSIVSVWEISVMTIAYLQIKDIYGRYGFVEQRKEDEAPSVKAVLLVGFTPEEAEKIRSAGIPAYGISPEFRTVSVKEILKSPERFQGYYPWEYGRYAILHNFKGDEIPGLISMINEHAGGSVRFASTTDVSVEWTLGYLLREMGASYNG